MDLERATRPPDSSHSPEKEHAGASELTRGRAQAWISPAGYAPYFIDETGYDWTPVGHNDAITWQSLSGILRHQNVAGVDAYLANLAHQGVTCIRLMLEYAQTKRGLFESRIGKFRPSMVAAWDTLFRLCARHGLRILLTPFDTFWTWKRWASHPYNRLNGGCLDHPSRLLLCPETREAIKQRLGFAIKRWGGSGTLFAWDLWNEIHPGQAEERIDCFEEFITDLSTYVRTKELALYGRSHPQTVSLFGPEIDWRPHLDFTPAIFRHPCLDFASIHIYRQGSIDDPPNTVSPALDMADIVERSLAKITDRRPFFDSEHGPIHRFKDHKKTLPEALDDEYFRHMQWAHLAAGGAGGGMRWPNRHPHVLTPGMHAAQRAMASFLPLIEWKLFKRENWTARIHVSPDTVRGVGCGDECQAVFWFVRTGPFRRRVLRTDVAPLEVVALIRGATAGTYRVVSWDTRTGTVISTWNPPATNAGLELRFTLQTDMAFAVRRN